MNKLRSFFHFISNIGIHDRLDSFEVIRMKIFNQGAIIFSLGIFITGLELLTHHPLFAIKIFVFSFVPLFALVLNFYGKIWVSRLYLTFFTPIILIYFAVLFGNFWGTTIVLIAYIIAITIGYKQSWIILTNIAFILLLYVVAVNYILERDGLQMEPFLSNHTKIVAALALITMMWVTWVFITEIKKHQQTLMLNNEKLARAVTENNLKNQLLEIIAHDLRQPVLSFRALTKKINYLIKKEDTSRLLELGNHYEQTSEQLFHDLDNLLAWVLSQKNNVNINRETIDLQKLVNEVKTSFIYGDQLRLQLIDNQIEDNIQTYSDKNILKIILRNIIQNAIKFSPVDTPVIISSNGSEKTLSVIVKDFGPGVRPDFLKKINTEKWIKENNRISETGFGIGINLCLSLIKFLNGRLEFQSEEGKGTKVFINLPVYPH